MKKVVVAAALMALVLVFAANLASAGEKPSFEFDWYGYFKLDGAYDQTKTSHGNFAMWVNPGEDNSQYNMTANQTRFGFNVNGQGYEKAKVGGKLEVDLYGASSAENKPALVIRHAYLTLQSGNTKLLAGQGWDLVSPLNPSTLNYTVLWGCGNYQYRRPQISLFQTIPAGKQTNINLAGGFFRNMGSDVITLSLATAGENADGDDDGTDAGIPSFQGRFEIDHKFNSGAKLRIGASGLYGQLKSETDAGNSENYTSWMAVGHLMFSLPSDIGISGEYHIGENTANYFGGILNSNTVEGINSAGVWASAWIKPSPKVKFTAGYGFDNVKEEDIGDGSRQNNQCLFGNVVYSIVANASVGVEVSQWQTEYKNDDTYSSLRAQTAVILSF